MRCTLLLALLLAAGAVRAEPQTLRFYGYAYDLQSGKYLYTEVYREEVDGDQWVSGHTSYYAPDGSRLGEKTLSFASDRYVPIYTLDLPSSGYSEGITTIGPDGLHLFKQTREKGRQSGVVAKLDPIVADSGFHAYLYDHMAELVAGKTLKFRFAAAGQLDSYSFRARKTGDLSFDGRAAIRLKIDPDSLLRFLVEPLILTYDPQTRQLLEYRGITNVVNPATGKPYNARIDYYSKPPDDAPRNLPPLD
jgi:hypothetical protein